MEWKCIKLWVMLHAKFVWMWHRRRGSALCVARIHSVNARLWSLLCTNWTFHQLVGFSCKVKRVSHVRIVYLLRLRWTPLAALLLKYIWLIHLHHWTPFSDFSIVNSWCGTLLFCQCTLSRWRRQWWRAWWGLTGNWRGSCAWRRSRWGAGRCLRG